MEDLEFVKKFSSINLKRICEIEGIDRANVVNGRTSKENITKVRKRIESELARLYIIPFPDIKKDKKEV